MMQLLWNHEKALEAIDNLPYVVYNSVKRAMDDLAANVYGRRLGLQIAELLDPDLVICSLKAQDAEKVIRYLGGLLYEKGLVRETFVEATLAREKEMPTGLPIGEINAAIPHADIEHVVEPALAVATLNEPVSFQVMVDPDESVKVSIVFLLALNKPHDQIEMLQKVAMILQDSTLLRALMGAKSSREILEILSKWTPA